MKFNRKQRTERSKTLNLRGNLNKKTPKNCTVFFYKIAGHRSILQHSGPSTIMFIIIISFIPTAYDSFIELLSVQKTLHSHTLIICYIHIKDHFLGMTEDGWFPGFVWCRCWFGSDKTSLLKEFTRTGGSTDTVTTMPATVLCTLWNDGLWQTNG